MQKALYCLFFSCLLLPWNLYGQKVYEIALKSFSDSRNLREINFVLFQNNKKVVEQQSKDGSFRFVIKFGDGLYRLEAKKEGYNAKIIHFPSNTYPFKINYEILEFDVEFHKVQNDLQQIEADELKCVNATDKFVMAPADGSSSSPNDNLGQKEDKMVAIYSTSIKKGDELFSQNEADNALIHYEVALMAKPGDEYALNKIQEIKKTGASSSALEKTTTANVTDKSPQKIQTKSDIYYTVQIAAINKKAHSSGYPGVKEFYAVESSDYVRVCSGNFEDVNEAIQRKNELVRMGYKDAWVVKIDGKKRSGIE